MEFHKGDLIQGKYYVEEQLGQGSYGVVYLARHMTLHTYRAIKMIDRQQLYPVAIREADILKRLRHPAIPIIYDIEETSSYMMIVEEYVPGCSLQSLIYPNLTISYRDVIQYTKQLCDVVEYLHEHMVSHQDIKPENILICHGRVRLIDYGSAIDLEHAGKNAAGTGTIGYAAPEQYETGGSEALSDIYSIGVVMLCMATGSRSQSALDEVPHRELCRVIRRCLSHTPKERYSSVRKLREALENLEQNTSVPVSYHIHFAGIQPHCGTTYCAVAASRELSRQHRHPLLREQNDSGAFHQLIRASNRLRYRGGIFAANGLDLLPEYHGAVEPVISPHYDTVLYDDGVVCAENADRILSGDLVCLVCGASPQELARLDAFLYSGLLPLHEEPERFRILINYADARRYKRIVRTMNLPNPIRVPYKPGIW